MNQKIKCLLHYLIKLNILSNTFFLILPVFFRLICDGDGWAVQCNEEPAYSHYLHIIPIENITHLQIKGDVSLR